MPSFIAIAAFRYALGRTSTAPTVVSEWILYHRSGLDAHTRSQMVREAEDAIEHGRAGHDCDVQTWRNFVRDLSDDFPIGHLTGTPFERTSENKIVLVLYSGNCPATCASRSPRGILAVLDVGDPLMFARYFFKGVACATGTVRSWRIKNKRQPSVCHMQGEGYELNTIAGGVEKGQELSVTFKVALSG